MNNSLHSSAKKILASPVGQDIKIEPFAGGKLIALRIPKGLQTLVKYIKQHNINVEWCTPGSCLEEVVEIEGICCMDVIILGD
jgi:hypothetical protein